jgi:hypothetical protein
MAPTKPKAPAGTPKRAARTLEEKMALQRELDGNRSPLLTTLQHLEEVHGRKELSLAINQWDEHAKEGPLSFGGVEPDTEPATLAERATSAPNVPVNSPAYIRWADEHPQHPAAKLAVREE